MLILKDELTVRYYPYRTDVRPIAKRERGKVVIALQIGSNKIQRYYNFESIMKEQEQFGANIDIETMNKKIVKIIDRTLKLISDKVLHSIVKRYSFNIDADFQKAIIKALEDYGAIQRNTNVSIKIENWDNSIPDGLK